jgi:DNA-binding transcriptional ArsR family regulator
MNFCRHVDEHDRLEKILPSAGRLTSATSLAPFVTEPAPRAKRRRESGPHNKSDDLKARASVFAVLGDKTRLSVLTKLSTGQPQSISRLTAGTNLSRQAVTKHLRVLVRAGVVHSTRVGRQSLFELEPQPIKAVRDYLDQVSKQWDDALARLKSHVEG